ncbi:hypothetical protein RRG08_055881 [Elysia crispata]|uniref:Uncharacterized protein n=1 Tax=Elysia crispata TaxID=231223 RepID=A0AAE0YED5_9GAST|nr:hypothetical protein RRG08_055881 [Elysia crispata]
MTSFLMFPVKLKPISSACQSLIICSDALERANGFFFRLDAFPKSELSWNKTWKNKCKARRKKIACTIRSRCNNKDYRKEARLARKHARFLCQPLGKEFYRRLFTEGTSTCLGNKTAFSLIQKNMEYCFRVNTSNFSTITNSELCKKINALRNCDADYAASICNDLQWWYIDRSWKALIEVYYRFCKGTLNPPAYNLPFRRSQPSRATNKKVESEVKEEKRTKEK